MTCNNEKNEMKTWMNNFMLLHTKFEYFSNQKWEMLTVITSSHSWTLVHLCWSASGAFNTGCPIVDLVLVFILFMQLAPLSGQLFPVLVTITACGTSISNEKDSLYLVLLLWAGNLVNVQLAGESHSGAFNDASSLLTDSSFLYHLGRSNQPNRRYHWSHTQEVQLLMLLVSLKDKTFQMQKVLARLYWIFHQYFHTMHWWTLYKDFSSSSACSVSDPSSFPRPNFNSIQSFTLWITVSTVMFLSLSFVLRRDGCTELKSTEFLWKTLDSSARIGRISVKMYIVPTNFWMCILLSSPSAVAPSGSLLKLCKVCMISSKLQWTDLTDLSKLSHLVSAAFTSLVTLFHFVFWYINILGISCNWYIWQFSLVNPYSTSKDFLMFPWHCLHNRYLCYCLSMIRHVSGNCSGCKQLLGW